MIKGNVFKANRYFYKRSIKNEIRPRLELIKKPLSKIVIDYIKDFITGIFSFIRKFYLLVLGMSYKMTAVFIFYIFMKKMQCMTSGEFIDLAIFNQFFHVYFR